MNEYFFIDIIVYVFRLVNLLDKIIVNMLCLQKYLAIFIKLASNFIDKLLFVLYIL